MAGKPKKGNQRVTVRKAKSEDADELATLFYETVHAINKKDYTEEQIHAWAPHVWTAEKTAERQKDHLTWVAVAKDHIVGFVELKASGYIDCFYCHKDFQRQGIGSLLFNAIEVTAEKKQIRTLFADVSITAKPFFLQLGFMVLEEQNVVRNEVSLPHFRMELVL